MVAPAVATLAKENEGKLIVGKLNVDEQSQIAGQVGIRSIPTLMIFKNGVPVNQIVGALPLASLRKEIAKFI